MHKWSCLPCCWTETVCVCGYLCVCVCVWIIPLKCSAGPTPQQPWNPQFINCVCPRSAWTAWCSVRRPCKDASKAVSGRRLLLYLTCQNTGPYLSQQCFSKDCRCCINKQHSQSSFPWVEGFVAASVNTCEGRCHKRHFSVAFFFSSCDLLNFLLDQNTHKCSKPTVIYKYNTFSKDFM